MSEFDLEDFYRNAPCGLMTLGRDGRIVAANLTLLNLLDYEHDSLIDLHLDDLLTPAGRIHVQTHFGPILTLNGHLEGIALDLLSSSRGRVPVFLTANTGPEETVRIAVLDARDRRTYERELLDARMRAEVLARTLQRSLVPSSLAPPAGMLACAHYHPASSDDVGGDFYDLFPLSDDKWGFFLGDVCGKGAAAAAVTSLTRYTLRAAAVYDDDPVAVLRNLDSVLHQEFHGTDPQFCTVVFGVLRRVGDGFDAVMASGGHPPPIVMRADGTAGPVVMTGGQLVGILPAARFVSATVRLTPGDTMLLYSDGLSEARTGAERRRYDDDGALLEFLVEHAPATPGGIVEELRMLLDGFGSGLEDDAALLAIGVPARGSV